MHQYKQEVEMRNVYKTAYTDACKTHYTIAVYTTVFLTMNPSSSKHAEDIKKLKIEILI